MRAVIQRVSEASVSISGKEKAAIRNGLLVLIGIEETDSNADIEWLSGKIVRLRIFGDENQLMNLSIQEVKGEILVISQFTLFADTKKGNRPSYIRAARPEIAIPIYNTFLDQLFNDLGAPVYSGEFGADMKVKLINDGPVTIFIDTKNKEA
jgi:D-aminoacyl-tRNA deacylase